MTLLNYSKIFSNILTEGDDNYYSPEQFIEFDIQEVAKYNPNKEIGFGYGKIIKANPKDYLVLLYNGQEIKVKKAHVYAFSGSDATPT